MITLLTFCVFFYGLYELIHYDFWSKTKKPRRRRRIKRRDHNSWITRAYDRWWPQSLRFYSFRPRKENYISQFAVRDQIKKDLTRDQIKKEVRRDPMKREGRRDQTKSR